MTLCIQASLSGDYQLPDDGVLVSGVYWLSLHPHVERFDKNVTIGIQHCASNFDNSTLFFITAKCTQEALPYTFKLLPGGVFSERDSSIQVNNFSSFGLLAWKIIKDYFKGKFYAFRLFYTPKPQLNEYEAHITVTEDLELYGKVIFKLN